MLCIRLSSLGYRSGGYEGSFRAERIEGEKGFVSGRVDAKGFVRNIRGMERYIRDFGCREEREIKDFANRRGLDRLCE